MSAYAVSARGLASRRVPQGVLTPMNTLLFGSGEQGALYDPSDLSTLFQDSAGTTPVTAVEQFVALMLDKSGRGNHASQATSAKRPKYSRRVNLTTESEFRNGVTDAPVRAGLVSATTLSGYLGAIAFGHDGATSGVAYKTMTPTVGVAYVMSVVVKMDDGAAPVFASHTSPGNTFALVISGGLATVSSTTSLGDGIYRVVASGVGASNVNFGIIKYTTNNSRTFKVTAYDIRLATDAHLPYQRVNTATDYDADPNKFPAYLACDGVDDAMQTGNIDFTGTDKMTVWAGFINLGVGTSELYGLSENPTINPAVMLRPTGGGGSSGDLGAYSRGSGPFSAVYAVGAGNPPATLLTTAESSISAPYVRLRINGTSGSQNLGNQGTGNYGNSPLYIGARAGIAACFNGRLYQLIVRGAQSSLSQIEAAELYTRRRMMLP